jgi:hypothetical protein
VIEPNVTGWKTIGRHSNSMYYEPAPNVLVAVPDRGVIDTGDSARMNVAFQRKMFEERGKPGVVLIFFDLIASLEVEARKVYQMETDPQFIRGIGLIGGTLLSRAMGSFFMGLAKPRVQLKMFGDPAQAIEWGKKLLDTEVRP